MRPKNSQEAERFRKEWIRMLMDGAIAKRRKQEKMRHETIDPVDVKIEINLMIQAVETGKIYT